MPLNFETSHASDETEKAERTNENALPKRGKTRQEI